MTKIVVNAGILLGLILTIFTSFTAYSLAHPGNTASDGMHYCWTNCSYYGEVYGQRHGHGGYTSSYTTTTNYESTYKSNLDCPSYSFAYLGSCYELPDNAKKSAFSGFTCDYGYDEVGYGLSKKCLPEIDNGYRIGTSIYCNFGYELRYNNCTKKDSSYGYSLGSSNFNYDLDPSYSCPKNSSGSGGDCFCNLGYEPNKDKDACKKISKKTNDKICRSDFGKNSLWTGKYDKEEEVPMCKCKKGFSWDEEGTSCVK